MKRAIWPLFFLLASSATGAQTPVIIDIGEQPPLLSVHGGIVNRVVEAAMARADHRVEFRWMPKGHRFPP